MFDSIAPAYDFMNSAMTLGMHRRWLDKTLRMAKTQAPEALRILDLATGTGDVALALARQFPHARVTGVDLSEGMLAQARKKLASEDPALAARISFEQGDCLNLDFETGTFDLATVAYGVRNFENLKKGFKEIRRVLAPGAVAIILELSRPENPLLRFGYDLYSERLIPFAGRLVSKDRRAYSYLPQSIKAMPKREEICSMLVDAGFSKAEYKTLMPGVVTIYQARKPIETK